MHDDSSAVSRWPYSAAATFVGLLCAGYVWSVTVGGGIASMSGFSIGGLSGGGYFLAGSLFTPAALHDGEWERVVSHVFLHGGLLHLAMNAGAILQLGRVLEAFTTRGRCWFTLLVSGVFGGLTTVAWAAISGEPNNAIGASGAACGIGTALIVLSRGVPALEEFRKQMITWVAVMLALGFLPMISMTGHLGGAIGGVVAGGVLRRRGFVRATGDRFGRGIDVAAGALTLIVVAALVLNVTRAYGRKAAIAELSAATNEIHVWLDQGYVSDAGAVAARLTGLALGSTLDESRRQILALAKQLQAIGGGRIDEHTAAEAREALAAMRWW